ncbi:hypothetical protein [Chlamydiifrater phoenicopteri]|uniref:hypothetical protein n=1 Tax=Chlamydiifrater phoenicopteri TaxID=2681469 RepID=UPI001BCBBD44|nr:hypothetical protein [Chlamydiifrater phoenicopteri]
MPNPPVTFISYSAQMKDILSQIIRDSAIHARWVNTLSYMENSGARKIAASEHPIMVKEEILKHAFEEFRHAYYLKTQIHRLTNDFLPSYKYDSTLGRSSSRYYLHSLDLQTTKFLRKELLLTGFELRSTAYILVTYAIELRAFELYEIYNTLLKESQSPITIKSILMEEIGHLKEMESELSLIQNGEQLLEKTCAIESSLCKNLLEAISSSLEKKALTSC